MKKHIVSILDHVNNRLWMSASVSKFPPVVNPWYLMKQFCRKRCPQQNHTISTFIRCQVTTVLTIWTCNSYGWEGKRVSNLMQGLWRRPLGNYAPPGSRTSPVTCPPLTHGCWRQEVQLRINVLRGCWLHIVLRTHNGACWYWQIELGLPTANNTVHNSHVLFASHCSPSCNQIVQWFANVPVWWFYFLWFLPRCMECRRGLAMRILSVGPFVSLSHARIVTKP